jgi:hypothetical protein
MNNKITGILITASLILNLFLVASIHVMADVTEWYVDDSNVSGTEDGTAANPYNTIAEAITAAFAGDVVIVSGGTYSESVDVNKSLEIKVAGGETATINPASGNGFNITADSVTIDGFTITGADIGLNLNGISACTIINNTISNCSTAIALSNANTNIIQGNTSSNGNGISLASQSNGNIIKNNVCSGGNGYLFSIIGSGGNTISGNSFSYNSFCNVNIEDCSYNIFVANEISHSYSGINILEGSVYYPWRNTFIYNTISENTMGVYATLSDYIGETYFKNNNFINNNVGIENEEGLGTCHASGNYWSGNTYNSTGSVDTSSPLASPVEYSIPEVESEVTTLTTTSTTTETSTTTSTATSTETSTTTATSTSTEISTTTSTTSLTETSTLTSTATETSTTTAIATDTVVRTISSISTVAEGTVTMLVPTTLVETESVTSTDTQTNTSTQFVTSTDTQSLTVTVSVPQTVNHTTTTTLTATEETLDWPLIIIISLAGLLAGGLVVAIIIRRI